MIRRQGLNADAPPLDDVAISCSAVAFGSTSRTTFLFAVSSDGSLSKKRRSGHASDEPALLILETILQWSRHFITGVIQAKPFRQPYLFRADASWGRLAAAVITFVAIGEGFADLVLIAQAEQGVVSSDPLTMREAR